MLFVIKVSGVDPAMARHLCRRTLEVGVLAISSIVSLEVAEGTSRLDVVLVVQ
jgi:hypothetical protein